MLEPLTSENQTTHRVKLIARVMAFAVVFTVTRPRWAYADLVRPPLVPANIQSPAGSKAFLHGHAVGTQNYVCLPSGSGFAWTLFGPQATLFNDGNQQVITHFLSGNPFEGDMPRATWQDPRDTSTVWGLAIASSSDTAFVAPDAIPWLLLRVVGAHEGPTRGHRLTATSFIQRLNTSGGIAPSTGCTVSTDVGKKALVPYTADYFFYKGGEGKSNDKSRSGGYRFSCPDLGSWAHVICPADRNLIAGSEVPKDFD